MASKRISRADALKAAAGAGAVVMPAAAMGSGFSEQLARAFASKGISPGRKGANINRPVVPVDDLQITGFPPQLVASSSEAVFTISLSTALGPLKPTALRASDGGSLLTQAAEGVVMSSAHFSVGTLNSVTPILATTIATAATIYGVQLSWVCDSPSVGNGELSLYLGDAAHNPVIHLADQQVIWTAGSVGNALYGSDNVSFPTPLSLAPALFQNGSLRFYVKCTLAGDFVIGGFLLYA